MATTATLPEPSPSAPAGAHAHPGADGFWRRSSWLPTTLYWTIHALCGLALVTGVSSSDLILLAVTFWVRMFAITGGYHRYFSHKSYKTSRAFQLALAVLGTSCVQKGPLWWAAGHRHHHRCSDQPGDMHSPRDGFWWSHNGWILGDTWVDTQLELIPDFARYPELVWLNRWHFVPPLALAALCFAIGGLSGVVWGFLISTTLLWHSTYTINSLSHRFGRRRYETGDDSRNNWALALLTMGEGWHNNHHHYQASARQGFFWWEIDVTYYVLRALAGVGLIWDIREPPAAVLAKHRIADS